MPLMERAESYRLATTAGHVIVFKAGEPINVPNNVVSEARAVGAVMVNVKDTPPLEKDPPTKEGLQAAVPTGDEREAMIRSAFDEIVVRNNPDDFTPGNKPKLVAVSNITKFKVDIAEIARLWSDYYAELQKKE